MLTDDIYGIIFDSDETWYLWSEGNGLLVNDGQLIDY